jgi:hypothetical protein
MSLQNGDKARDHRERKQNIQRRKRTRELYLAAGIKPSQTVAGQRPASATAKKDQA